MELILFIGIRAAGKSTFYPRQFVDTHLRVGMDPVRTRHRERELVRSCLATGQQLVIDDTNPTAAERARYIAPAQAAGFRLIGYFFEPAPRGCEGRNAARARQLPPAGLFGTLKRLERPRLEGGFDALWHGGLGEDGAFQVGDHPA